MPSSLHPLPVLQQLACGQQQCFGLPTTSTWGYLNLRAASRQQRFLHSTEGKLVPARRENGGDNGAAGGDNGNSDDDGDGDGAARENLLTIPNVLTVSRMAATPYLGWLLAQGDLQPALALFFVAGVSINIFIYYMILFNYNNATWGDHCVLVSSPDGSLLYRVLCMLTCVNILIAVACPFRSLMLWTAGSHVHGMVYLLLS